MGLGEFIRRNALFIGLVAVVVAIVALGVFVARAVLPASHIEVDESERRSEAAYVSPYDWSNLDRTDGRYRYVVDGQVKSRLGIDVSENQHVIDWNAVAQDGIEFAMVRVGYRGATEGELYTDGQFWNNIDGVQTAGIDCGVYFFSQAISEQEAIEEADFVIETLNGTPLQYPIAFDSEPVALNGAISRTENLGTGEMSAVANAFCKRVREAGYKAMVYGNARDLARYRLSELEEHEIWWAEYGAFSPSARTDIAIWQYSNSGSVAGIETAVDMNIDLES